MSEKIIVQTILPLTAREKFALAAHMLQNILPKDHEEGIKYYDVFVECGLEDSKRILSSTKAAEQNKIGISDIDDEVSFDCPIQSSTLAYLLEILNKPMAGIHALSLVPVRVKLTRIQSEKFEKAKKKE